MIPAAAARISRAPLDDASLGQPVRIAGYGRTTATDDTSVGRRMSATTTIAGFDDTGLGIAGLPNFCLSDSGGPTYLVASGAVVGVHSLVDTAACNGKGLDTRVDPYVDFIEGWVAFADPPAPDLAPDLDGRDGAPAEGSGCSTIGSRQRNGSMASVGSAWPLAVLALVLGLRRRPSGPGRYRAGPAPSPCG
jgi:hypothetical protein